MKKPPRLKITKAQLEGQMFKIERRIQKMAERAYKVRQAIEQLDALEATNHAIYLKRLEGTTSSGSTNIYSREFNIPSSTTPETVLEKQ